MELGNTIASVLQSYGLKPSELSIERINSGHINRTYKVAPGYILQRINKQVFLNPKALSDNLRVASDFLKTQAPDYLFLHAIKTFSGDDLVLDDDGYPWRLFPYFENTITIDEVNTKQQAYAAARAFGLLSRHLSGCDINKFEETIPQFHDLSLRYTQFEEALKKATAERKRLTAQLIDGYVHYNYLVNKYNDLTHSNQLKLRVTHNDTKINNVLFERNSDKVVCVIDLDTLMPGYFIYDLGDMIRTFVSPSSEEETDVSKIEIRKEIYDAILDGYLAEMDSILSNEEKRAIPLAGSIMTYMIGLRFLTDFLSGDIYFHTSYAHQNLNRATNQLYLLKRLEVQA
ncbi:MAG: aminoglycoside phosphotransferase family protein [Cyclobacteriaceae bacterium]|nr:aminoglycoside phosphotransferase family protein [Cyclobacteriaceae bacterium]